MSPRARRVLGAQKGTGERGRREEREGEREREEGGGERKKVCMLTSSPCQALCQQKSPPPPMPTECLSLIKGWLPFFNHKE